ncbi:hypothetical protein BDW59DRAFT_178407 [Aspergillus cavernicola]|uniref:Rhodopsin domain-containing protein n=1 Tax=Aspergillus cavernicola TaxID=176166 RepID=A0ABR4INS9_9EURO
MLISLTFPPGVRAPLSTDNDNNHSGLIVVITSFFLVLILASLFARIFSSYRKRMIQRDDYMFAVLVLVAFIQASIVLVQVHYGWGTRFASVLGRNRDRMLKTGYTADILSIAVLGFSKVATCLFYESLFHQMQRRFIRAILTASMIWIVLSILLLAIRCGSHPWNDISDRCSGLFPRWQAITALDVVIEVLLAIYSTYAIHNVQIPFRKKIMVLSALECRIILIPLAAIRLYYINTQLTSSHPPLLGAYATTATEIYLSLSVVCQITSSFKFIVAVYEDKDGVSYTDGSSRSMYKLSKNPVSTDTSSSANKIRSYISGGGGDRDRLVDYESFHASVVDPRAERRGLRILRSVELSMQDEGIELVESGMARGAVL